MLSLVAGPTDIVPLDPLEAAVLVTTSPPPGAWGSGLSGFWEDGRGLWFVSDTGSTHAGEIYLVHLDGKAVRVGYRMTYSIRGLAQAPDEGLEVLAYDPGYDKWFKTHLPVMDEVGPIHTEGQPGDVVLADRYLWCSWGPGGSSASVSSYSYPTSHSNGVEHTFTGTASGSGNPALFDAGLVSGHRCLWCLDKGSGSLLHYDATARTEGPAARTSLGSGVRLAGYSVKLGLFVAVRRDTTRTPNVDQLYVYANEPVAASISAPSFSPAPARGGSSLLSSRVLGTLAEPCAGRNVAFTVSSGSLESSVTATDSEGYARTRWFGPTDGAPQGATATATLTE